MSHKTKKRGQWGGHVCPPDPLEEIEKEQGTELSGKLHEAAEPPVKLPKKIRGSRKESYRPLHRR